jgi:hypothetical protein
MHALIADAQECRLIDRERLEATPSNVERLPQIVRRRGRRQFRPEQLVELLSVERVVGCERQHLDELRGFAAPPGRTGQFSISDGDTEAAEQLYPEN